MISSLCAKIMPLTIYDHDACYRHYTDVMHRDAMVTAGYVPGAALSDLQESSMEQKKLARYVRYATLPELTDCD